MKKVRSFFKKTVKVVLWVIVVIVLTLATIAVLIQIPLIQNSIVQYATSFISNKTHTRVEIKNINISFPSLVVIEGLFLEDLQKDTLLFAGKTTVNIVLYDLLSEKISVRLFSIEDATINLSRKSTDSLFNFNFLLTAFGSNSDQAVVKKEPASGWTFSIDDARLRNIRFRYGDEYGGTIIAASVGSATLLMDEIDFVTAVYDIDELLIESLRASILIAKKPTGSEKAPGMELPKIQANRIQINNAAVTYGDSLSKQSAIAAISRFEIKDGYVDLQQEFVTVEKFSLSKSAIQYNSVEANHYTDTTVTSTQQAYGSGWKIAAKNVVLDDNTLAYQVVNKPETGNVFDADHMKYSNVKLYAKDFFYSADTTEVSINKFSATDQHNFSITELETDFSMDQHSITVANLKVKTVNSSVVADARIEYSSLKSFKDSLPFVMMNVNMEEVSIINSDILYFSPQLISQPFFRHKKNKTTISGIVKGRLNQLSGKNVVITTGGRTVLTTDFSIAGLPAVSTAYYDFPTLRVITGNRDIGMIAGSSIPNSIALPENIVMQVVFKGRLKSFTSRIGMVSSFGSATLAATMDDKENFSGSVDVTGFDLGRLLKDTAMFGPVTMIAQAQGHGLDKNTMIAKIDAEVSQIQLNHYTYHKLKLDGHISGQEFEGRVNLDDKNAVFELEGLVNIRQQQEKYTFTLNMSGADLQKLNITKDDIRVGFVAAADFTGNALNTLNGKAGISNIVIAKGDKIYELDSFLLASVNEAGKSELKCSSALFGLDYSGTISPADLFDELNNFINNYFPFSDSHQLKEQRQASNFTFEIRLRNHPILSQVLLPQLTAFEPGIIRGRFDSGESSLELTADMKKIVYGAFEISDFQLAVNSDPAALSCNISSNSITTSRIKLENFLFEGKLADHKLFAAVSSIANNQDKKLMIRSQMTKDKSNYRLVFDPEDFYLMNKRWDVAADNYLLFGEEGFIVHHFFIKNEGSQINISSVNEQFNDDLNISITDFRLDDISRIIEKDSSLLKGKVDGTVLLKRVNKSYGIIADAKISKLVVREIPIGDLSVKADNPTASRFDIEVELKGSDNNLVAKGYFIPNGGDNSISIKTTIQSLSLKAVEAFSMGQLAEASGTITGDLFIQGEANAPEITGELVFIDAFIKPAFLNNRFELKHETVQIQRQGIYFQSFTLLDADQHAAVISGTIQMKQYKDFIFDLHVAAKDFLLFNTTLQDNKEFYGRMVIDSKIDVSGPLALPVVNATIKMKKGSNFTFVVPEGKLTTDKGEDVVTFEDTLYQNSILYKKRKSTGQQSGLTGIDLSSVIEVDKQATLRLLMDPSSTDSLVVRGEAALSFTIDRSGKMSLTGAYNLNEGSYLVSLKSVLKKKFEINPGSTIIWNGDPLDAEISINATYAVRASPIDLVADQMSGLSEVEKSAYKQRYPFWVLLKLRGKILHPVISFEIQLPPENRGVLGGAVNAKLNQLNEDPSGLNKQVFALLVLGRFIQENPLQTDAAYGTSTLVRSTVGKFLSAQLNQLNSKVLPGVELNFDIQSYDDYGTGQAEGRTQVEIGLKKQLFTERLTVQLGGTVDVEGEKAAGNSASDITSDVTLEYKLTKDGRYRLKGFRHNQNQGAIEGQIIETGIGVSYVRDFNEWRDLFSKPEKRKEIQSEKGE